jgi:hypothetical protein
MVRVAAFVAEHDRSVAEMEALANGASVTVGEECLCDSGGPGVPA